MDTTSVNITSAAALKRPAEGAMKMAAIPQIPRWYITTARDGRFCGVLQEFVSGTLAMAHDNEKNREGRILVVTGTSGAGKSRLMEETIDKVIGLEKGDFSSSAATSANLCRKLDASTPNDGPNLLTFPAPSPCTGKQLGLTLLERTGYSGMRATATESQIWQQVRLRLRVAGVRFVWIDEFHHAMGRSGHTDLVKLCDNMKSLLQTAWPVSLILSGLPALSSFIGFDRQIERRSRTHRLEQLEFPDDARLVKGLVHEVVTKHAGMALTRDILTDEFAHRLIVAAEGGLGSVVDMARSAAFSARVRAGLSASVEVQDFAKVYAGQRACSREENIFLVQDWQRVAPSGSRIGDGSHMARKMRGGKKWK